MTVEKSVVGLFTLILVVVGFLVFYSSFVNNYSLSTNDPMTNFSRDFTALYENATSVAEDSNKQVFDSTSDKGSENINTLNSFKSAKILISRTPNIAYHFLVYSSNALGGIVPPWVFGGLLAFMGLIIVFAFIKYFKPGGGDF